MDVSAICGNHGLSKKIVAYNLSMVPNICDYKYERIILITTI